MELDILMNLAASDKERACLEYRKRYGKTPVAFGTKGVCIYPSIHTRMSHCIDCVFTADMPVGICIMDLRFWCRFSETFGHLVEDLYIISTYLDDDVLADFTALKKLHLIENMNAVGYNDEQSVIWKCCPSVEFLEAEGMKFSRRLTLHECFPNLNGLTLRTFIAFSSSRLEASFSKLEQLQRLELTYCDYGSDKMADMIDSMPKLKHFHTNIIMKMWSGNDVCRFLKKCERLTTLKLSLNSSEQVSTWCSNIADGWKITNQGDKITIEKI